MCTALTVLESVSHGVGMPVRALVYLPFLGPFSRLQVLLTALQPAPSPGEREPWSSGESKWEVLLQWIEIIVTTQSLLVTVRKVVCLNGNPVVLRNSAVPRTQAEICHAHMPDSSEAEIMGASALLTGVCPVSCNFLRWHLTCKRKFWVQRKVHGFAGTLRKRPPFRPPTGSLTGPGPGASRTGASRTGTALAPSPGWTWALPAPSLCSVPPWSPGRFFLLHMSSPSWGLTQCRWAEHAGARVHSAWRGLAAQQAAQPSACRAPRSSPLPVALGVAAHWRHWRDCALPGLLSVRISSVKVSDCCCFPVIFPLIKQSSVCIVNFGDGP